EAQLAASQRRLSGAREPQTEIVAEFRSFGREELRIERRPGVLAEDMQVETAEAHLGVLARVDLQADDSLERFGIEGIGRGHVVDPGADPGTDAFDAVAVPLAWTECLATRLVLLEVLQPAAAALLVEA